jgi:hypothetical protein
MTCNYAQPWAPKSSWWLPPARFTDFSGAECSLQCLGAEVLDQNRSIESPEPTKFYNVTYIGNSYDTHEAFLGDTV